MVLKIFISLFILTLSLQSFAVRNPGYYGQKDFSLYYGAKDLLYSVDPYQGDVTFEDTDIKNRYIYNKISPDLLDHQKFFTQKLQNALSCPQWEMARMYDYLRFANRVVALSYIYESIRLQKKTTKMLGVKNKCEIDWQKIIKQCKPETNEMKLFVKSAKHILKYEKEPIIDVSHSIKTYQRDWQRQYKSKQFKDVSHYRVHFYCEEEYCNKTLSYKTAAKIMDKNCHKDTELFISICSEQDNLYGMSKIEEAYPLLAQSDILTYYDDHGHALGCLRRFKQQNQSKEVNNKLLEYTFPIIYQQLSQDDERFIQGPLFFAGTLSQFAKKGLENVYREDKKEKVVKKEKKAKKKKVYKKQDKVEFIDRYVEKKIKKKIEKKRAKKKKEKKEPKKSSFLVAVELQNQLDLESVPVDMRRFRYDFLFSIPLKNMLDKNLDVYTTRRGLKQMKKFDHLGTLEGPMPLMFLKYLIDTKKHHSLFNILNVVGNKFYVNNDIDPLANTEYDYIELKNNESTNNQWQINVLAVPEPEQEQPPAKL